jgi:hypothetical protein
MCVDLLHTHGPYEALGAFVMSPEQWGNEPNWKWSSREIHLLFQLASGNKRRWRVFANQCLTISNTLRWFECQVSVPLWIYQKRFKTVHSFLPIGRLIAWFCMEPFLKEGNFLIGYNNIILTIPLRACSNVSPISLQVALISMHFFNNLLLKVFFHTVYYWNVTNSVWPT